MDQSTLADVVEWDTENWSPALTYWRQHSSVELPGCSALEIGSRHGGLSLWLALSGARVVCSDLAGPTDTAKRKHERYGVSHLITYEEIDALDVPYTSAFDIVIVKSVFGGISRDGHLERQDLAVRQIHKALKPRGELWFAENLVASPLHRLSRSTFVSWAQSWRYPSIGELMASLQPFDSVSCDTWGVLGAFGRSERQRAILGRMDKLFLSSIVPSTWRYIAAGVARK